jgi:hypothetical protein
MQAFHCIERLQNFLDDLLAEDLASIHIATALGVVANRPRKLDFGNFRVKSRRKLQYLVL